MSESTTVNSTCVHYIPSVRNTQKLENNTYPRNISLALQVSAPACCNKYGIISICVRLKIIPVKDGVCVCVCV